MLGKEPNKKFDNLKDRSPKILDEVHFLESANDSARHFRNVYAAYLIIMLYIFVVILSVDHELLFRAGDKQLPLINISVPIVEFFTWMPFALLIVHFYLLVQAAFLSGKIRLYKSRLEIHLEDKDIDTAKRLLSSLPLAHILVDKGFQGKQPFMLYLIVFISLVIFPLVVLIMAQIQFLLYQDMLITLLHRVIVMIDIGLLWYFYFRIFVVRGEWWGSFEREGDSKLIHKFSEIPISVSLIASIAFLGIAFLSIGFVRSLETIPKHFDLPNYKLVKREPASEILATYTNKGANNEKLIEPGSSIWCKYADPLDLKGRDFIKAQLKNTTLCNVNLEGANLTDANLIGAKLPDADLRGADLTGADLKEVDLTGADLGGADLTGAGLTDANLEGANLTSANLPDAGLPDANLTGANLTGANLGSVNFTSANLTGVNLFRANLTSAYLTKANLTSAHLVYTDLTAANLSKTNFSEVIISNETVLDYTWVWEGDLPIGIPKGWDTTTKPEYICPRGFFISHYIFEYSSEEEKQKKLKNALGQLIKEKCKPYTNAPK